MSNYSSPQQVALGGELDVNLAFTPTRIIVTNPGDFWLFFVSMQTWVPPTVTGAVLWWTGTNTFPITTVPPIGYTNGVAPQQNASFIFTDDDSIAPTSGIPLVTTINGTPTFTLTGPVTISSSGAPITVNQVAPQLCYPFILISSPGGELIAPPGSGKSLYVERIICQFPTSAVGEQYIFYSPAGTQLLRMGIVQPTTDASPVVLEYSLLQLPVNQGIYVQSEDGSAMTMTGTIIYSTANPGSQNVQELSGIPVSNTSPTDQETLVYVAADNEWEPKPVPAGPPGMIWLGAWNSATNYVVSDAVSSAGNSYICILANTNQSPPNATYWNLLAQAGSGAVSSVFGRTGAVIAASGDYTDELVTNSPTQLMTAKGDLITASAPNTLARLPIGTIGQVPTVQASGVLAYATPAGGSITSLSSFIPSNVSLSGSPTNITSLSLTTGTWLVMFTALVQTILSGGETSEIWIGPSSASRSGAYCSTEFGANSVTGGNILASQTGVAIVTVASTTTIYLEGDASIGTVYATTSYNSIANSTGMVAVLL